MTELSIAEQYNNWTCRIDELLRRLDQRGLPENLHHHMRSLIIAKFREPTAQLDQSQACQMTRTYV